MDDLNNPHKHLMRSCHEDNMVISKSFSLEAMAQTKAKSKRRNRHLSQLRRGLYPGHYYNRAAMPREQSTQVTG